MLVLLEIILLFAVLFALWSCAAFRRWWKEQGRSHCQIGLIVIALLIVGHLVNQSRSTFPFVRWAMYTDVYEPDSMEWGKFRAGLANGDEVWINPAIEFPSLSRNFFDRLYDLSQSASKNTLTPKGEYAFDELMRALAEQHNRRCSGNPIVRLDAVIEDIHVNRKSSSEYRVIRSIRIDPDSRALTLLGAREK